MRINKISFKNFLTGLEIEEIEFNKDITLLVGLSGVGKTQILSAINYSVSLASKSQKRLIPSKCRMHFSCNNEEYIWEYEIKHTDTNILSNESEEYYFASEKLTRGATVLFERNKEDKVYVDGYNEIPMPKKNESMISQYSDDNNFKVLYKEFKKFYDIDLELNIRGAVEANSFLEFRKKIDEVIKNEPELKIQSFSHMPIPMKIYILKNYYEDEYIRIFDIIKELFMEISDIEVVYNKLDEVYVVAIEVYGKIIEQYNISNGMLKSLYYIIEWMTLPKDSIVLIDEFENGLGVNCIDVLAEMITDDCPDIQFIITSHHPKIINNFTPNKWKIIDRNISKVINMDANQKGIGNSKHNAYFNLLNRWEYEGKI